LTEPAHVTLGISTSMLDSSTHMKSMGSFLNEPFEYWLPMGLLRLEGNRNDRLHLDDCTLGTPITVLQGQEAEDALEREALSVVAECFGENGEELNVSGIETSPSIREDSCNAAKTGSPSVFKEPLQRLLWPRVDGRAGPGHGVFGKRAVLLQVSQPRALVVALDQHQRRTSTNVRGGGSGLHGGRDGGSYALNPFACFSGSDGAVCSAPADLCFMAQCGELAGSDSEGGVLVYWEGEFLSRWSKRVPPHRRSQQRLPISTDTDNGT